MRGNADRNASVVIGKRLLARYRPQEKPPTPPVTKKLAERSTKVEGDARSHDAKRRERPSTNPARHGKRVEHGTAQDALEGMAENASGIPHPLRLFTE